MIKTAFTFILGLLTTTSVFAENNNFGTIESASKSIFVTDQQGQKKEYILTDELKVADTSDKVLRLSFAGARSKCSDYLGRLAQKFTMTIKNSEGKITKYSVKANKNIEVYGVCEGKTNLLNQLTIEGNDPSQITVKVLN